MCLNEECWSPKLKRSLSYHQHNILFLGCYGLGTAAFEVAVCLPHICTHDQNWDQRYIQSVAMGQWLTDCQLWHDGFKLYTITYLKNNSLKLCECWISWVKSISGQDWRKAEVFNATQMQFVCARERGTERRQNVSGWVCLAACLFWVESLRLFSFSSSGDQIMTAIG